MSPDQIRHLRALVEQRTADLTLRFELGAALCRAGEYNQAIPELQRARMSPIHQIEAMERLADAFDALGYSDLAP